MGIRIFNFEFDKIGSVLCALTSLLLVGLAFILALEFGEYLISQILSFFK
jgi:hypothetical protein